jgi:hypothetical protein
MTKQLTAAGIPKMKAWPVAGLCQGEEPEASGDASRERRFGLNLTFASGFTSANFCLQ